jgi:protocatechuate 3,4-dioxygenase, alpha subunit
VSEREETIPSGSQTVGPYFTIGMRTLADEIAIADAAAGTIEVRGNVVDGDGFPVPDAMLELWGAEGQGVYVGPNRSAEELPAGFHRLITDGEGRFSARISKPALVQFGDGRTQAPHFLVLVFARGLLRHLITRLYFSGEETNETDPVLLGVPAERRHTLVAQPDGSNPQVYQWNVVLQGRDETAFFAW